MASPLLQRRLWYQALFRRDRRVLGRSVGGQEDRAVAIIVLAVWSGSYATQWHCVNLVVNL